MQHCYPSYDPVLHQVSSWSVDGALPTLPIIGVDECANNGAIAQLARQVLKESLALMVRPLWLQLHKTEDGRTSMYSGSANAAVRELHDLGTPVKGHSWQDKYVVQLLVAQLGTSANVVLLTENRRRDQGGLCSILGEVVGPAMRLPEYQHLSLSVLMKRGKTTWAEYASKVLGHLQTQLVNPGYTYVEL
jgi:hypothetical protein